MTYVKNKLTISQVLYLLCSIVGLIGTQYFNFMYYLQDGYFIGWWDAKNWFWDGFLNPDGSLNPASSFLTFEAYIFCFACIIWMWFESKRLKMKYFLWYVIGGLFLAFAFTVPLYLYFREKKMKELKSEKVNS